MRISDWSSDVCSSDLAGRASVLVLGLTFKENVPDLRNTRVVDLVRGLQAYGHDVAVHDPLADPAEAKREYGIDLLASPDRGYDCVVVAVPPRAYDDFDLGRALHPGGLVADIKGLWRGQTRPDGIRRGSLRSGARRWGEEGGSTW